MEGSGHWVIRRRKEDRVWRFDASGLGGRSHGQGELCTQDSVQRRVLSARGVATGAALRLCPGVQSAGFAGPHVALTPAPSHSWKWFRTSSEAGEARVPPDTWWEEKGSW